MLPIISFHFTCKRSAHVGFSQKYCLFVLNVYNITNTHTVHARERSERNFEMKFITPDILFETFEKAVMKIAENLVGSNEKLSETIKHLAITERKDLQRHQGRSEDVAKLKFCWSSMHFVQPNSVQCDMKRYGHPDIRIHISENSGMHSNLDVILCQGKAMLVDNRFHLYK